MEKNKNLKVIGEILVYGLKEIPTNQKNTINLTFDDKELDFYEVVEVMDINGHKVYVTNQYNDSRRLQLIPENAVYNYNEY